MKIGRGAPVAAQGSGFTLIEVLVSFSALLVVLLGFTRMLLSSSIAASTTHEATLAKEAARAKIEELRAADFSTLFAVYGAAPDFAISGLDAMLGDADGQPGEILFPVQAGMLSETLALPEFGLPADLNGDGDAEDADVTADYRVLPVVVRVEWRGSGCAGRVEFRTLMGDF
jgi:type II secretory pathway pseudopilin PulG